MASWYIVRGKALVYEINVQSAVQVAGGVIDGQNTPVNERKIDKLL